MTLNNFCKGTSVGVIELMLDLNLKQKVKGKVNTLRLGAFFALFITITIDCAFELICFEALCFTRESIDAFIHSTSIRYASST